MFWSQFLLTIRSDRDMMKIVAPNFFASKNLAAKNALDCSKMSKINIGLKELAPIYFHDFRLFRLCFSYLCIYLRSWMNTTFADISIVFLNAQNDKYSSLIRTNSFIEFSRTPEIFFRFKIGGVQFTDWTDASKSEPWMFLLLSFSHLTSWSEIRILCL